MSIYREEITERSTSRVQEHEMIHINSFFRVNILRKKRLGRQSRKNHVGSVGLPETHLFFWPK